MNCTICQHPQRQAIDLALLNRTATLARLSEQHRLSTSALHRHKQHLLHKMAQAQNRFQDLLREGYLFKLNKFLEKVLRVVDTAGAEGNDRLLLQAVRQGTGIMKFMAQLDSSFSPETVHRLLASPQWAAPGASCPPTPSSSPTAIRPWPTVSSPPARSLAPRRRPWSTADCLKLPRGHLPTCSPSSPACPSPWGSPAPTLILPGGKKAGKNREKHPSR